MLKISLIPTPYKVLIGVALLAAAVGFGHYWGYGAADQAWQLKDTARIAAEQAAKIKADAEKERERRVHRAKVAAMDAQHQKEMNDAQVKADQLLRDARTRAVRLYAKSAKPATLGVYESGASSVADAETQCELDPTTAEDLIRITSDGDAAIRQLTALQQYVSDVCLNQE